MEDTQNKLDSWCRKYNYERRNSSLNDITPAEFIQSLRKNKIADLVLFSGKRSRAGGETY
ncbi:hypothetical protein [Serratia marcescens]|uniref:hypothetical protein n=1 Tax=Serratia marcescens TaxID=615 RepID=UPI00374F17A0